MSKIKEAVTSITAGEPANIARVTREERVPMSDKRFFAILKSIVAVCAIAATAKVVPQIDNYKLFILGAIIVVMEVAYFIYDKGI